MDLFFNFLSYLGVSVALLVIGIIVFAFVTKEKEFSLISRGNVAAALSLGGKIVGLSFVLGSSVTNSISLVDMVIWGAVGIVAQITIYYLVELLTIRFSISKAIEEDNKSVGTLLLILSVSIGWIIAQCLTY